MDIFSILFNDAPKITKLMTITCVAISLLTWLEIISPLYVYYNEELIFKKHQVRIYTIYLFYLFYSIGDCLLTFFTSETFQLVCYFT